MSSEPDEGAAAENVAKAAQRAGVSVATAESLTGGRIAAALAAAPGASTWFKGGVVCYADDVKHDVLGVPPGPVISAAAATAMAAGVARLTGADFAVAVSGVGGPDKQEDQPVGTVFAALHGPEGGRVEHHRLGGEPEQIVATTVRLALDLLRQSMPSV